MVAPRLAGVPRVDGVRWRLEAGVAPTAGSAAGDRACRPRPSTSVMLARVDGPAAPEAAPVVAAPGATESRTPWRACEPPRACEGPCSVRDACRGTERPPAAGACTSVGPLATRDVVVPGCLVPDVTVWLTSAVAVPKSRMARRRGAERGIAARRGWCVAVSRGKATVTSPPNRSSVSSSPAPVTPGAATALVPRNVSDASCARRLGACAASPLPSVGCENQVCAASRLREATHHRRVSSGPPAATDSRVTP